MFILNINSLITLVHSALKFIYLTKSAITLANHCLQLLDLLYPDEYIKNGTLHWQILCLHFISFNFIFIKNIGLALFTNKSPNQNWYYCIINTKMNKLKINTYNKKLIKKVKNEVILTFDRLNIYNLIQKKKINVFRYFIYGKIFKILQSRLLRLFVTRLWGLRI